MAGGEKQYSLGFGDKPFVPFFESADFASVAANAVEAEVLALAALGMTSIGRPPMIWEERIYADDATQNGLHIPINPGRLDVPLVQASARQRPQNLQGFYRSMLETGVSLEVFGARDRVLAKGALLGLEYFSNVNNYHDVPSEGDLERVFDGVGRQTAVLVASSHGKRSALIGKNTDKLKQHVPGNAGHEPSEGTYIGIGDVVKDLKAGGTMAVLSQPNEGIHGTYIRRS